MKNLMIGLIIGILISAGTITLAQSDISLIINGQEIETEVPPRIEDGRTLVPIRVISEELGYEVDWDDENNAVIIEDGNMESENDYTENENDVNDFETEVEWYEFTGYDYEGAEGATRTSERPIMFIKDEIYISPGIVDRSTNLGIEYESLNDSSYFSIYDHDNNLIGEYDTKHVREHEKGEIEPIIVDANDRTYFSKTYFEEEKALLNIEIDEENKYIDISLK